MKVIIKTSLGDITVRLYDETPLHRDNFVKLAREGYYDGTLFHRVIKDFMIQGGDPDSKGAPAGKQLGIGGPDYTIEAEIKPTLFHKRGALAAARQGDEVNPERRSSGSQFYIVWGQVYNQGQIKQFAKQMEMQQMQQAFNALAMQHHEEIMQLRRDRNRAGLQELQDKLANEAQQQVKANGAGMTAEQQKIYTTIGGTPHLDGQYTVFGEVEEGLDIVDQIQQAATGRGDRPIEDIEMNHSHFIIYLAFNIFLALSTRSFVGVGTLASGYSMPSFSYLNVPSVWYGKTSIRSIFFNVDRKSCRRCRYASLSVIPGTSTWRIHTDFAISER